MDIKNILGKTALIVGLIALVYGLSSSPLTGFTDTSDDGKKDISVTDGMASIIVMFDTSPTQNILDRLATLGAVITHHYKIIQGLALTIPAVMMDHVKNLPGLTSIDNNDILTIDRTPNDPSYPTWGMPMIQAPAAWDTTIGSSSVLVAVIDEGVDVNHQDLAANIWVNSGEIAGNGIDDDGNGYIDDVNGYNFADNNAQVFCGSANCDTHGTHVSGTIGAVGDNGIGVAGVNWNVKIMALKFLSASGGSTASGIEAIEYATAMGAKVISASWGGGGSSTAMKTAIEAFPGLFVAASGNSNVNTDTSPITCLGCG